MLILYSVTIMAMLCFFIAIFFFMQKKFNDLGLWIHAFDMQFERVDKQLKAIEILQHKQDAFLGDLLNKQSNNLHITLTQTQQENMQYLQNMMIKMMQELREQLFNTLRVNTQELQEKFAVLTKQLKLELTQMGDMVDKRLTGSFQKTSETFLQVLERLTVIDTAQKKITELSSNIIDLQMILNDKRARGAFGEVQLQVLLENVLPQQAFVMQYTLSNGKRVDCLLKLPPPTGNIAIDAKFPLETYQRLLAEDVNDADKKLLQQQFRQDIKKHIRDISEKYILPQETAGGAILFLPSESVFVEIHKNYQDLVSYAQQVRVWLCSPTTMMAVLTTAAAVLKDVATQKQVCIIQEHLALLAKDFMRFGDRFEKLAKHIQQAHQDVDEIHTSAKKITARFEKIEKADLTPVLEKNRLELSVDVV